MFLCQKYSVVDLFYVFFTYILFCFALYIRCILCCLESPHLLPVSQTVRQIHAETFLLCKHFCDKKSCGMEEYLKGVLQRKIGSFTVHQLYTDRHTHRQTNRQHDKQNSILTDRQTRFCINRQTDTQAALQSGLCVIRIRTGNVYPPGSGWIKIPTISSFYLQTDFSHLLRHIFPEYLDFDPGPQNTGCEQML